jgi:hypothetical protein
MRASAPTESQVDQRKAHDMTHPSEDISRSATEALAKRDIEKLRPVVPAAVLDYILEHDLYRGTS